MDQALDDLLEGKYLAHHAAMGSSAMQATARWGHLHISVFFTHFWADHIAPIAVPGLTCPGTVSLAEPRRTEGARTWLNVGLSPVVFGS